MTATTSSASFSKLSKPQLTLFASEYARAPVDRRLMVGCARELVVRGLLQDAERLLSRAAAAGAEDSEAQELLAALLHARAAYREAAGALERVLDRNPTNARAWSQLGIVYSELAEWRFAKEAFESAAALAPDEPRNLIGLAMAFLAMQDVRRAQQVRDDLLERFADLSHGHLIDGHLSKIVGQTRRAIAAYRNALAREPTLTDAVFNLADLDPPAPDTEFACAMEKLRAGEISARDRVNACFSLGRIYDAAGWYELAFARFCEGNHTAVQAMKWRGIEYDPDAAAKAVDRIIGNYPERAFGTSMAATGVDLRMIFIVGLPRSGTTLVEQILAAHSQVAAGGELPLAQECLQEFQARRQQRGADSIVDPAQPADAELLLEMREKYLDGLFERELDSRYVTDKLPGNFAALGFIRMLFPDALIVHCRRDPVAVCWSLYTAHFGMHEPYYNSFEHLADYHRHYRRVMAHWSRVLDPPIVEVEYERLVADPEGEIRRLLLQCDLAWERACLEFQEADRPVFTASQLQVRRPIYLSSVARWRNYENWLDPLRKLLEVSAP